jgi:hypothetical protein
MRCYQFYKPQQTNPTGRIPPNRLIYEGVPIQPEVEVAYKNSVVDSVNANTYTKNQAYSYASQTQTRYSCLILK